MIFEEFKEFAFGYTALTEVDGKHKDMLMDIGIYKFKEGETLSLLDEGKESALLLLDGTVTMKWLDQEQRMERHSVFDEEPWCLHVPKGVKVEVVAHEVSEVLIQKAHNERDFESKCYTPEDCKTEVFGENVLGDTSRRLVRTIFDYNNAPYSNMVNGEVIHFPGKWSSYPPHHHPQPEVYFYKFNKLQGFGCSIVGDEVFKVTHNSICAIPGHLVHPQVTAPGYAMYYCWMIRHIEGNPWTERITLDEHKWLLDKDVKVWPEDK